MCIRVEIHKQIEQAIQMHSHKKSIRRELIFSIGVMSMSPWMQINGSHPIKIDMTYPFLQLCLLSMNIHSYFHSLTPRQSVHPVHIPGTKLQPVLCRRSIGQMIERLCAGQCSQK
ncbi:hypothetical protein XU18_4927 [Perkinsela sp. CCAP 1560/4]|nr:hypothetical protein XU18_4927 [Perkinsela sp. CCAP 1560/4]|eukprot:KNH03732.1 hypothetical protein XU18_4927 [Perkinsela sp. CCAP 1560/4]